ncbi:response regulator transcription factor [Flavobacterium haoranii]|uniref:Two component transcriptional regulator, LuxR family n=1 Tax=Flavobacterium haoranii TaxID=683124 RepID=A0A1M6D6A5_9FLAO|nr:response regulator transcription factor [Flavobacterium haoranii]SHI68673.1 two component transcriptional regulator, LuxR family [Flavobacterium haoranii]
MTKICIADNHPVVLQGVKSYFKDSVFFDVSSLATNLESLLNILQNKNVDILILDIELDGISSIRDLKELTKDFPETKIVIFSAVSEKMYAPTAIKAGVKGYVEKKSSLKELENALKKIIDGGVVYSDDVRKQIDLLGRGKKKERLFKKLSTREIEVLRYLNDGKKNKEIAEILSLDEKTISTYKLRLLAKLNVTNFVDLLSKAKTLDII